MSRERGDVAALAAVLIWALVPVGTRFFVLEVDPYVFNIVRYIATGLSAVPLFLKAKPWRWPIADQRLALACAALGIPGYNIPVALGARGVSAGQLGLLIATEPALIIVIALLLTRHRIPRRLVSGCLLALLGVTLTSGVASSGAALEVPAALEVLVGATSWSFYTVLIARLYRRQGALAVTGAILLVGSALLILVSLPLARGATWPDARGDLELAIMGIAGSTFGFLFWNYAGSHVPAARLGLFLYLIPVGSVSAGALLLGEPLTASLLTGGALTMLGVWVATRGGRGLAPAPVES